MTKKKGKQDMSMPAVIIVAAFFLTLGAGIIYYQSENDRLLSLVNKMYQMESDSLTKPKVSHTREIITPFPRNKNSK